MKNNKNDDCIFCFSILFSKIKIEYKDFPIVTTNCYFKHSKQIDFSSFFEQNKKCFDNIKLKLECPVCKELLDKDVFFIKEENNELICPKCIALNIILSSSTNKKKKGKKKNTNKKDNEPKYTTLISLFKGLLPKEPVKIENNLLDDKIIEKEKNEIIEKYQQYRDIIVNEKYLKNLDKLFNFICNLNELKKLISNVYRENKGYLSKNFYENINGIYSFNDLFENFLNNFSIENEKNSDFKSKSLNIIVKTLNEHYNNLMNNSTKMNNMTKKSSYTALKKYSFKSQYSSKNINTEKNLKKYYRLIPVNKQNHTNTNNNINNIIPKRNENIFTKFINLTTFNSNNASFKEKTRNNSNKNIISKQSQSLIRKNRSFISKSKPNSIYKNKTSISLKKKKVDLPLNNYFHKIINTKKKIPIKKNQLVVDKKFKLLYPNNNELKNRINCKNNSIFNTDIYDYKNKSKKYNITSNNNTNDNNNYYDLNKSKIIINTVYNSFTNNIYPFPHKTNFTNYKKFCNNNRTYNYLGNPSLIINRTNEVKKGNDIYNNKNIAKSNNNNYEQNLNLLLTDYSSNNNHNNLKKNRVLKDLNKYYIINNLLKILKLPPIIK